MRRVLEFTRWLCGIGIAIEETGYGQEHICTGGSPVPARGKISYGVKYPPPYRKRAGNIMRAVPVSGTQLFQPAGRLVKFVP